MFKHKKENREKDCCKLRFFVIGGLIVFFIIFGLYNYVNHGFSLTNFFTGNEVQTEQRAVTVYVDGTEVFHVEGLLRIEKTENSIFIRDDGTGKDYSIVGEYTFIDEPLE